jgi:hypothetical protein
MARYADHDEASGRLPPGLVDEVVQYLVNVADVARPSPPHTP